MKRFFFVITFLLLTSGQAYSSDMKEIGCRHVYAKALTRFNGLGRVWLVEESSSLHVPKKFREIVSTNDEIFLSLNLIASHAPGKASQVSELNEILRDIDQRSLEVQEKIEQLAFNEYLFISSISDVIAEINQQANDLNIFYTSDRCATYATSFDDLRPSLQAWSAQLQRMAAFMQIVTVKRHKLVQYVVEGKKQQLKQDFASRQKLALDELEANLSEFFVALDFQTDFGNWNARTTRPIQALIYDARQYHEAKAALIGLIKGAETYRSRALLFKGLSEENRATILRPIDSRLEILRGQLAQTEKEGWQGYQLRQKKFLEDVLARRSLFSVKCIARAESYLAAQVRAVNTMERRELDVSFIATKIECGKGA